jgi:hypothetical protein
MNMPASSFSAYKVTAQVNVTTVMSHLPRFILQVIKPAVPKETRNFESKAPFRSLKQEGSDLRRRAQGHDAANPFLHCWNAADRHNR